MQILTFGDLHIGKKASNSFFLDLDKKVVEMICNKVRQSKIDKVIFLGDLFHSRSETSPKAMGVARDILDQLESLNLPVIMILGNHDTHYNNKKEANYYRIFDGLYKNITFVEDFLEDRDFLYVGWLQTDEEEERYKQLSKKYRWVFGHLEFKGVAMSEYYQSTSGLENDNPDSFIISGHIHQRTQMSKLHYVGSPYPQTWHGKNRHDYGYAVIDTSADTVDYTDLNLYYFNEYRLQKLLMIILMDKNRIKKEMLNSETRVKVDVPLDERQLADIKIFLNTFKPRNLLVERDMPSERVDSVDYDKLILASPIEFITNYIQSMTVDPQQKNRILEKVRNILSQ